MTVKILLDADTLLEFLLNRDATIYEVEELQKIINLDDVQICISKLGLDRINLAINPLHDSRNLKKIIAKIRKCFKILKYTKIVAQQARFFDNLNWESAVEITLAIRYKIGAIVTHKPNDFSQRDLSILTIKEFQQRQNLNNLFERETKDRPAVLVIDTETIKTLEHIFSLPSKHKIQPSLVKSNRKVSNCKNLVEQLKQEQNQFLNGQKLRLSQLEN